MTRIFSRDGPVASITRLQTRSGNRNRRVPLMTLSPELRLLLRRAKIDCHSTLRVCPQSNPSVPNLISAPSSKPGCLAIWRVRRFAACGRQTLRSATLSVCRRTPGTSTRLVRCAGFGPIDGEEVGRLLTRLLGEPDTIAAAVHPPVISPLAEDSQSQQANPIRSRIKQPTRNWWPGICQRSALR